MGIFITRKKKKLLAEHGWYRNMNGGFAHPHAMDHMTRAEIAKCSDDELAYKLRHGSMAEMPGKAKKVPKTQNNDAWRSEPYT